MQVEKTRFHQPKLGNRAYMYVKRCLEFTTVAGYSSGRIINPEEGLLREALEEWSLASFHCGQT